MSVASFAANTSLPAETLSFARNLKICFVYLSFFTSSNKMTFEYAFPFAAQDVTKRNHAN